MGPHSLNKFCLNTDLGVKRLAVSCLSLCLLAGCGNPIGSVTEIDSSFHPGIPTPGELQNVEEYIAMTPSFTSVQGLDATGLAGEPVIEALSGLPADFNHSAAVPVGVTPSVHGALSVEATSCSVTCEVRELYYGILAYIYGS